jgi:hypothetical protein
VLQLPEFVVNFFNFIWEHQGMGKVFVVWWAGLAGDTLSIRMSVQA